MLIKHVRRLVVAKRTISIKTNFYCIFFSSDSIAVKILMSRGRRVTGMYYPDVTLKKLKEYHLLHDYVPSHTSELLEPYLELEKVTVLAHKPYSPDLAPCDFFLFFQNLKCSCLVVVTSPGNSLAQPTVSASEVDLNERTV